MTVEENGRGSERRKSEHRRVRTSKGGLGFQIFNVLFDFRRSDFRRCDPFPRKSY
jgi:hypothetical protein